MSIIHQAPGLVIGGASGPWVTIGTLGSPVEIHVASGSTWHERLWGRLSDSIPLGLFNGYLNFTDNGSGSFPWTQTLNVGLVHYDPRLDYDEDAWWFRWNHVDNTGVTMSINGASFNVFTSADTAFIGMAGAGGAAVTIVFDWATAADVGSIVHTVYFRLIFDL